MAKIIAAGLLAIGISGHCGAAEPCEVEISVDDTSVFIDAHACTADQPTFWSLVERRLPKPLPLGIKTLGIVGPRGTDQISAMAEAFGQACRSKPFDSERFIELYRDLPASKVLAPSLAKFGSLLDSTDNYYVLELSSTRSAIRSPGCKFELLQPVLYYRLQAPNNSFKPRPLRGSAAW